jgi:predicted ATPase
MLPTGTVTFMFTDIEGSTARWEADSHRMRAALEEHNTILSRIASEFGGYVFKTIGDAFCVAFPDVEAAAESALQAQRRLTQAKDPVLIRIGLHTASIRPTDDDYFGQPVNRVARIMSAAHGGQIILSDATKVLLPSRLALKDLGEHGLKDLLEPSRLWQLGPGEFGPIKSLTAHRNNLPIQTTSFVGRQDELRDLGALLGKSRLITLTGTGGTGKSRLALHFAAENMDRFPDGVWFAELAALPDRENVLRELVTCVGAPETAGSAIDRLIVFFGSKRNCLIIDNCEHVLDIVSETAEKLVKACPNLTVLATSREPLGAAGESPYRVPSLPAPTPNQARSLRQLEDFGSCALFIERLSTAVPNYGLADGDAPTIAKICTRLDGIPLALELAAARGRAMTLDQVEKRLDDRFRLLTGGSRNALSRQQTLQALIDWSVQLLNDREKRVFVSLAVFAGGWDLEGAEAVCGCEELDVEAWEVLDLLTALVDKSLVIFEHGSVRYKMLESIRQYAAEELMRQLWSIDLRNRHSDHFISCADPKFHGEVRVMVLPPAQVRVFASDYENIRAALEWACSDPVRAARAALVAVALWPGFLSLERSAEMVRQLEPLMEAAEGQLSEADFDWCRVTLAVACARSEDPRAPSMLESVRKILPRLSKERRGAAGTALGYGLFRARRFEEASEVIESLLVAGAEVSETGIGYVWCIAGLARSCRGDFDTAEFQFRRACDELAAEGDWRAVAANRNNLAIMACLRGRYPEAVPHILETNCICTEKRVNLIMRGIVLAVFSLIALNSGDLRSGAAFYGGAVAGVPEGADPPDPLDAMFEQLVREKIEAIKERENPIAAGRYHDWEPWHKALVSLKAEDVFPDDGFVLPFPELLPGV